MTPSSDKPKPLPSFLLDSEFGHITKWILLSSVIGVCGGVAAIGFRWMIEFMTEHVFRGQTGISGDGMFGMSTKWWLILLLPAVGGLITGFLVQRFAPEAEGHGTDSAIKSYHHLQGIIRKRVIFLKALTSAITIGTGGSAGQEGPVAQVGAGVGSSISNALGLTARDRRIFLLSGASAGIGAMFCSPLGGALFMPEVLYKKPEFEGEGIIPCILASIIAYTTFTTLSGHHAVIEIDPVTLENLAFGHPSELLVYLVLGVLCALIGWIYVKTFYGVHKGFARMSPVPKAVRPAVGGLLLGATALGLAEVTSENGIFFGGYGLIQSAIESDALSIKVLLALIVAKILATSFTISSGGSGGVFAPALAIGALVGALTAKLAGLVGFEVDAAALALVGMGGFFAGVAKVPIASVIMVCEMTGSYALLAPLMLVAVVHMLLSAHWTMYEAQVDSPIDSPAHTGDFVVDVLQNIQVREVFDEEAHKPLLIRHDTTLREVLRIVSRAKESYFPVVDGDERLVGIFSLNDLRRIYLEDVVEDLVIVRDFMVEAVVTTHMQENLAEVLRRMTQHNINAIPVVDREDPGIILALMERNEFGRAYDKRLRDLKRRDEKDA